MSVRAWASALLGCIQGGLYVMKVLIIGPAHKRNRTEHYIARGFSAAGHRVRHFSGSGLTWLPGGTADRMLERIVRSWQPEYVLSTRARGVRPETLARICRGRSSAMWYFDAPPEIPDDVLDKACAMGTLFLTNRGHAEYYRSRGVKRVLFLPQACDDAYHRYRPLHGGTRYQLSFVGKAGSEQSRQQFLDMAGQHLDVHVWGEANDPSAGYHLHRKPVYNHRLASVIGASHAVLGANSFASMDTVEAYASNRVWLTLGCGGFYVGHRNPGIEDVVPHQYAQYYANVEELVEKVLYYECHADKREAIRTDGCRWAHAFHTYRHRVANLVAFREFGCGGAQ